MDDPTHQIKEILGKHVEHILQSISEKYDIDFTELKAAYLMPEKKKKTASAAKKDDDTKKPRGRKKKQKDEFIDPEEYVYEGKTYLVDAKNCVYTNNVDAPRIVGERLVDGTIRFYEVDNTV